MFRKKAPRLARRVSYLRRRAVDCRRPFAHGVFCGFPLGRFISFEAPLVAGGSVLPVPKYAFAGPGGVLPLLTSLLAPPGLPSPPLDMPVPPPPAANAKPGIKISATVAKDLSFIAFLQVLEMSREMGDNVTVEEMFLALLNDAKCSEHGVGVDRGLRDRLDHVPVLDDLAAFQPKDVHHRLSARIIGQTVPMIVKDDVVAVGKDTLDLAMSIRMIRHDPGDELLHAFHPVFDERIVLAIGGAGVKLKSVFDLTFEQGSLVEVDDDVLVGLRHGLSPQVTTLCRGCRRSRAGERVTAPLVPHRP